MRRTCEGKRLPLACPNAHVPLRQHIFQGAGQFSMGPIAADRYHLALSSVSRVNAESARRRYGSSMPSTCSTPPRCARAAQLLGVHRNTTFRWRDRFLTVAKTDQPHGLDDIAEADELCIRSPETLLKATLEAFPHLTVTWPIISPAYLESCYQLGQQYPGLCSSIFFLCESSAPALVTEKLAA